MTRRNMMTYSLAAVAMTLTGCKAVTTTIVVVNESGARLSVSAKGTYKKKSYSFVKKNIANGKSAKQKYVSTAKKGTVIDVEVLSLLIGGVAVPGPYPTLPVVIGKTNTFTIYEGGALTPPDEEEEETV